LEKNKIKNIAVSQIVDGILAGFMIGIGGTVSLSCDNKYIGAVLFGLGLFSIIFFKFGLYTGKVGYIPSRKPLYIKEVVLTLVGNTIGTFLSAMIIRCTRISPPLIEKAVNTMGAKTSDGVLSMFMLAFFCGMLMFMAVEGCRISRAENNSTASVVSVFWPVIVFIISGFNHCIADMFYFFLAGMRDLGASAVYFPVIIIGNAAGGMFIPFMKKFTIDPL